VLVVGGIIWAIGDHYGLWPEGTINFFDTSQDASQPSNELIYPDELSKNPYRLKGHSGILDTTHVSIRGAKVEPFAFSFPGCCMRFEKMIDEDTATYEVLAGGESGEIAVVLDDSDPPDPTRPWHIIVEGARDATNGFGAAISVSTVRFEGYASLPIAAQAASPSPANQSAGEPAETHAQNVSPSRDSKPASTALSPSEASASDGSAAIPYNTQFDQKLTACILSNAPRNSLSSSDTGLYALHILNDLCQPQYSAWIKKCMAAGDTQRNCVSTSLTLAQDELKQFVK
jgi:hypothetical protein